MPRKLLVTGATGFLGKHLVDYLLERGENVRALDFRQLDESIGDWKDVEFLKVDIRDKDAIKAACRGADYVYHLAAIPSIARAKLDTYWSINVEGARNVLTEAKRAGARGAIYLSSSTVYGIPEKCPLSEEDPLTPVGFYGKSKIAAEEVCPEVATTDFPVSIIRPRVIMGAGRIGIFGILFRTILNNNRVYLIGQGKNRFQFTDVHDLIRAIIQVANYPQSEVFNIGAEKMGSVREDMQALIDYAKSKSKITPLPAALARMALKTSALFGVAPLMNEQFSIADRDFKLDTAKAQRLLNWQPQKSNLETIIDAFDWYRDNYYGSGYQYRKIFSVLGKFSHSQQGGFQKS